MRAALLAGAALALSAAAAAADDPGRTVAGAGGHFLTSIQTRGGTFDFSEAQTAPLRAQSAKAVELFRAMPNVSNPPPPACALIYSREGDSVFGRAVAASISVMTPELKQDGSCDVETEMGTAITLNQPQGLPRPPPPGDPVDNHWEILPIVDKRPGYIELPSNIFFYESRAEPIKPISVERYARDQLRQLTDGGRHDGGPLAAEWNRRLASWSPAERAADACMDGDMLYASPNNDCAVDRKAYEFNRAFFDTSRPWDVQIVGFHFPDAHSIESPASWSVREPIPRLIDRRALAGLLARP